MKDKIFENIKLNNGVILENRFVLAPMVTNSSTKDGFVTKDDLDYAIRRAKSASLQITGAAYVDEYGQLFEYGFSSCKDEDIEGLSKLAVAMKSKGAKAILQLTHAGRFSSHTLNKYGFVYGPSPMHLNSPIEHNVKELSINQIENLVLAYANATRRAIKAGFDGVEISSAQRLLIQTFFSRFSNERNDKYGSQNLENRARFTLKIFKAVQEVIDKEAPKDFILGFRATPEETRGNQIGYSVEEFMILMDWLLDLVKLDYLAIASWGHNVFRNKVRASGEFKGELVNKVIFDRFSDKLTIISNGGINTYDKVLEALEYSHMVGLSTPLLVDPEFIQKIWNDKIDDINLKISYFDLESLAIPKSCFKDIIPLMEYCETIPKEDIEIFRELSLTYKEREK
ncbi:MAG: NADH-dependent flavin oxidoreductase [Oceanivirga sp.]|nr:NADH-dependent flavin oxidoreductase [Oceanivirga sp.]